MSSTNKDGDEGTTQSWSRGGPGLMLPPAPRAPTKPKNNQPQESSKPPEQLPTDQAQTALPEGVTLKYTEPVWSPQKPIHPYSFEIIKEGCVIGTADISKKGFVLVGRMPVCDLSLDHNTISRQHAIVQHRSNGNVYVYDLDSTHGTFVGKKRIKSRIYHQIKDGDVVKFGGSTRLYILMGGPKQEEEEEKPFAVPTKASTEAEDPEKEQIEATAGEEKGDETPMVVEANSKAPTGSEGSSSVFSGNAEEFNKYMRKVQHQQRQKGKQQAMDKKTAEMMKSLTEGDEKPKNNNKNAKNAKKKDDDEIDYDAAADDEVDEEQEARLAEWHEDFGGRTVGVSENYEESYDDDDFFDRSKRKDGKQRITSSNVVETTESLTAKKKKLAALREEIFFRIDSLKSKERDKKDDDSLDSYMSSLSNNMVRDEIHKLEDRMKEHAEEEQRLDRLIQISTSTLSKVQPKQPISTTTKAPKATTNVQNKGLSDLLQREYVLQQEQEEKQEREVKDILEKADKSNPKSNIKKTPVGGKRNLQSAVFDSPDDESQSKLSKIPFPPKDNQQPQDPSSPAAKKQKKKASEEADPEDDADSKWVPPPNQTGDGRTYLNDLYGY